MFDLINRQLYRWDLHNEPEKANDEVIFYQPNPNKCYADRPCQEMGPYHSQFSFTATVFLLTREENKAQAWFKVLVSIKIR